MKTNLYGISDQDKSDIGDLNTSDWDSDDEDGSSEAESGMDYE